MPTHLVAHLQNRTSPTLKPSFANEPPSQHTKPDQNGQNGLHKNVAYIVTLFRFRATEGLVQQGCFFNFMKTLLTFIKLLGIFVFYGRRKSNFS